MIVRNCAGGVVFFENSVLLIENDKGEWTFPKGVIRDKKSRREIALERVQIEANIKARILCAAGDTSYEFYSLTRRQPVCNRVHWYVMTAQSAQCCVSQEEGFTQGGFFAVEEALSQITYTQEKELLRIAYEKYRAELES